MHWNYLKKNQLTKVGIMHLHLLSSLKERIQHIVAMFRIILQQQNFVPH